MKWYFAVGGKSGIDMLLEEKVQSILVSFAYCRKGLPENLVKACSRGLNLMIDSGGFTNGIKPGSVKIEDYLEFLKEWRSKVSEYVVLDDPRKRQITLNNMDRMTKEGYKPIFVDHIWFKWVPQLEGAYKSGLKVCWGGMGSSSKGAVGDWAKTDRWRKISDRISQRYAKAKSSPLSRIHLLAVGQRLRRYLPWLDVVDSFDAATWCRAPGQYGKWCLFYPATKDVPYPIFRQISSESYSGVRPPKEVFEQADRYGLNLHKYDDRIRMAIKELKKYYRALEVFYHSASKKGVEYLQEVSLRKEEPLPDKARPLLLQIPFQKKISSSAKTEALQSRREDEVEPGRFFYQPKPTRAAFVEEAQSVERLVSLFEERKDKWLPSIVQKKYDGARHQVHRDGDKVTIYSEEGEDNTKRLPETVDEILKLKSRHFVLDVEIEAWDGRQHLPREVAAARLHSKDEPDDSMLITNIFDVLYLDEDIHKKSTKERLRALDELGIKQQTMGVPNLDFRLNAAPGVEVSTVKQLERVVRKFGKLPGSEGIVAKQINASYTLDLVTEDEWVKYHNATQIRGVVHDRTPVKDSLGVWTLHYGVLPGSEEPVKTVSAKGQKLVPVGDTFNTSRDLKPGDGVLVEAETVNYEHTPDGIKLSAWVPRVLGSWERKPDSVDSAVNRAKKNMVLQEKKIRDGEVTYIPVAKVEKQKDPYTEYPPGDKRIRYVVHHHFRGRSLHVDLRIGIHPGKNLIGWTLNTQIEGGIKEPVTTLAEAKSVARNMDKISKINWNTGEWAERPKGGTDELVRTSILCERKAPEPWAWMDVEGKTDDPEKGKPPPVGGTRNYPGVFHIVDKGEVEFGAQKPWLHEYFFHGGALNGRLIFRRLKLGSVEKRTVLPPSDSPEEATIDEHRWLAILPDDLQPYVLDKSAVEKKWIPPVGHSALPAVIRSQIPSKYRFWNQKSESKVREVRDSLVEAIGEKEVKLDYEAPYRKQKTDKSSNLDAEFVLQEQTFRGPIQVRIGPSNRRWFIRLDTGRADLLVLEFVNNPLDNEKLGATREKSPHKDSMKLEGKIKPGHYLNPTKETPSSIEILDKGKVEVLNLASDFLKMEFHGRQLEGLYQAKKNPEGDEWLFEPAQDKPEIKKGEQVKTEVFVPIIKAEKRLVTGIVLEPDTIDAQKDTIDKDSIEKAAHRFLSRYNKETKLGLLHRMFGSIGVELAESWIAPVEFNLGGTKVKKGTWLMTVKVISDGVWKKIKSGDITGFSIGGHATTVPAVA